MKPNKIFVGKLVIVLVLIVMFTNCCFAIPPVAAEFHGWVIIEGEHAPSGTRVKVSDSQGVVCGETITDEEGTYGLLSCVGDDPSTAEDEGAEDKEGLIFYVNDVKMNTQDSVFWESGSFREVNLVVGGVDKAKQLLEEPRPAGLNQNLYIVFLLLLVLISTFVLAVVAWKIWKAIKKLSKETEALKIDEL